MKRIINGTTYDTNTATEVICIGNENSPAWWGLYQTRHGAFFKVICQHDGETIAYEPLGDQEAQQLVEHHANHLVEQYFGAMPEHGAAEKRLTLRIPLGLANRVAHAASKEGINVNWYIARCLERCVGDRSEAAA